MTLVGLAVVVSIRGVLLVRRVDRAPPFAFPGGLVEPGEHPAATAAREVLEETGLRVVASHELGRRTHPTTGAELVYVACTAPAPDDPLTLAPREVSVVGWWPIPEALATIPDVYEPVRAWLLARRGGP